MRNWLAPSPAQHAVATDILDWSSMELLVDGRLQMAVSKGTLVAYELDHTEKLATIHQVLDLASGFDADDEEVAEATMFIDTIKEDLQWTE